MGHRGKQTIFKGSLQQYGAKVSKMCIPSEMVIELLEIYAKK